MIGGDDDNSADGDCDIGYDQGFNEKNEGKG